jgi:hypothetical protein
MEDSRRTEKITEDERKTKDGKRSENGKEWRLTRCEDWRPGCRVCPETRKLVRTTSRSKRQSVDSKSLKMFRMSLDKGTAKMYSLE